MNKIDFDNALRKQCFSLTALCDDQIKGIYEGLKNCLNTESLRNIKRIVLTGCGDSYVACKVAVPALKKYAPHVDVQSVRAIEATRFVEFPDPEHTLVIGISASGTPNRMVETMRRANHHGCISLAVTNNTESPCGLEAKSVLCVNTPLFPDSSPGLRNYYASIMGLVMFAAQLGEAQGTAKSGSLDALATAIRNFTGSYEPIMEKIDDQMFDLAKKWKDYRGFDYIGDDIEFASAFFCGAKVVEVAGAPITWDDSEGWCHVNYFMKDPETTGTLFMADKYAADKTRIGETISQASGIGRPVFLVANGTKEDFGIKADIDVCTLPQAPKGYEFLLPLLDYLPGSILAGYISTMRGEPFFRGGVGAWFEEDVMTIKTSEIVVV